MIHVVRLPVAVVSSKPRGAEMLQAGRIVGDELELDYAVFASRFRNPPLPAYVCLAGQELKAMLGRLGITPTPGCKCIARANDMDRRGCDWCEANIDTIVGWLREEAMNRGLPFVDAAGRLLVRRAIANARRKPRGT